MHIFEWLELEPHNENERKVKRFLDFRTRSAMFQYKNEDKIKGLKCYCYYNNEKYRIVGASRLGDVWLCSTDSAEYDIDFPTYTNRVDIEDCSNFSFIDNRILL
jgi:hypothetical protein